MEGLCPNNITDREAATTDQALQLTTYLIVPTYVLLSTKVVHFKSPVLYHLKQRKRDSRLEHSELDVAQEQLNAYRNYKKQWYG